jgi:hypothetical protein
MCSFIGEPQIYEHFFKKLILRAYNRSTAGVRRGIRTFITSVYKRYNSKTIFLYGAEGYIFKLVVQNKAHAEKPGNKTKKKLIFIQS